MAACQSHRKSRAPAVGRGDARPTFRRERAALKRGVWPVAGCDEAGRGPLAGPVVAAAVILDPDDVPRGLDNSKRLTRERREVLYERICAARRWRWRWRRRGASIATTSCAPRSGRCARAVASLPVKPRLVFVDGRDRINSACDCQAVIGGDGLVASIAAASIVAKVTRDRLMRSSARPSGLRFRTPHGLQRARAFCRARPAWADDPSSPLVFAGRRRARPSRSGRWAILPRPFCPCRCERQLSDLASRLGLVLNSSPYQKREEIWCGFGFFQNGATGSKLSSTLSGITHGSINIPL